VLDPKNSQLQCEHIAVGGFLGKAFAVGGFFGKALRSWWIFIRRNRMDLFPRKIVFAALLGLSGEGERKQLCNICHPLWHIK